MIQGIIQCATIACVQGMLGATLEYSSGNFYMLRSGDTMYACQAFNFQRGHSTFGCSKTDREVPRW